MSFVALTTVVAAGCIVPVPLERDTSPNSKPRLVNELLDPPVGEPLTRTDADVFDFKVVAEDDDLDDTLLARLSRQNPRGPGRAAIQTITLTSTNDAENPSRRANSFDAKSYCASLNVTGSAYVYVRVTDSGFRNDSDDTTNGPYDEAYWVLTCQ